MTLQTALVVDDSKLARITLQRLLQKHNLQVELAESGVQAIEMLESARPDIIFMDHLMPVLDGFEATKKIKANPNTAHIPVIMCTGKEVENYDEQARGIGASGTLSKPPKPDQLSVVLAAARSGENLVSHRVAEPQPETKPREESIPTATTVAQKPAAPDTQTAGADISDLVARIETLEKQKKDIPSFDAFETRMTASETSILGLQDAIIDLKGAMSDANPQISDEQLSPLRTQLDSFNEKLTEFKNQIPQAESLREEIQAHMEESVATRMNSVLGTFREELVNSQENMPDTKEITARVVQEVEQAITPLLEEEIKNLEKRLSVTIDDAVSESRKDLDDQLHESIKEAELKAKPIPGEPDLDNLIERIRADISDIATHTATAAVDVNLEDRLAAFKEQITKAREDIQNVAQSAAEKADVKGIVNDPQLQTMIEGTVEEMLRVQISKQGQELVQQIAKAIREQTEEKEQEIAEISSKFETLEQSNIELVGKISDLEQRNQAPAETSGSGSAGIIVGAIALLTAVAAAAKAFGVF
ncbi:response regulator [Hahella ganghwensis]|uniref:response regulator n=1 Tax=Hahella ganghwensis TaxID=286420 RepID=UPI0012F7CEEC|nr:response regulator [Hahella ganghwensis]